MVPNNTISNRRRLDDHLDDAVLVVCCSAEVKLRRGEAPRYLEAKITQLHKRLLKTTRIVEQGGSDDKSVVTVITPTICSLSAPVPSSLDTTNGRGLISINNISDTNSVSTISAASTSMSHESSWTSNRSCPAPKRQATASLAISSPPGPPDNKGSIHQQHLCAEDGWGHFVDAAISDPTVSTRSCTSPPYRHFLRREIQSTSDTARQYQPPSYYR